MVLEPVYRQLSILYMIESFLEPRLWAVLNPLYDIIVFNEEGTSSRHKKFLWL